MGLIEWILLCLPAFAANALPVVFSGNTPIDQGYRFADGNPLLGKNKTFRGFLAGVAGGTMVGMVLAYQFKEFFPGLAVPEKVAASFLLSIGAMIGDALGSFLKRRLGLASGQKAVTDAVTFMIAALVLTGAAFPIVVNLLGVEGFLFVMGFAAVSHRGFNWLAHGLKLKRVPW